MKIVCSLRNGDEKEISMSDKYDVLKIENQLCFPLYACAKEIVRRYKPFLDEIDLTYTQYITMMVLWEQKQLIVRRRDDGDERNAIVGLTKAGEELKEKAVEISYKMAGCISLDEKDGKELHRHRRCDMLCLCEFIVVLGQCIGG